MKPLDNCVLVACGEDGFPLGAGWPAIRGELLTVCRASAEHHRKVGFTPPWAGYLLCRGGEFVGGGAFVAPPENGRVEIAYFTLPRHERQGLGTTTAAMLVEIAHRTDPGLELWAKTLPFENASTAILRSLGFRHAGFAEDDDVGDAWAWSLPPVPG